MSGGRSRTYDQYLFLEVPMKGILSIIVLSLSLTVVSGSLSAENWNCEYQGQWQTNKTGNSGALAWSVRWVKRGGNWTVIGDMTDKYGASEVRGTCADKKCTLTQTYSTGSLVGKPYTYEGSYTDKFDGDSKSVNQFSGTWKGNNTTGTWTATAVCTKE